MLRITKENQQEIYQTLYDFPTAVLILYENSIVYSNLVSKKLIQDVESSSLNELLGHSASFAKKRIELLLSGESTTVPTEYMIKNQNGDIVYVEATAYPIPFLSSTALLIMAHDLSKRNHDTYLTSNAQQKQFDTNLLQFHHLHVESLYVPAKHISGDCYFFHPVGEDEVVGVIADVSGKGSLAAMMISSFEMLFHESIEKVDTLEEVVHRINKKYTQYFKDRYIAALFFHFKDGAFTFISAGINKFTLVDNNNCCSLKVIKGPFLGMLSEDSFKLFDSLVLPAKDIKYIYLYSDGFEELLLAHVIDCNFGMGDSMLKNITYLKNQICGYKQSVSMLKDDVSMITIDANFNGITKDFTIYGHEKLPKLAEEITQTLANAKDQFNIKLILYELVVNAFKHGNKGKDFLPIYIRTLKTKDRMILKVTDTAIKSKDFAVKISVADEDVLQSDGRGLLLISSICESIYYDRNTVIAEYSIQM